MYTMMIPAMDAVNSKRLGILTTDTATIIGEFHDTDQPLENHGDAWQLSRPHYIISTAPTSIEHIFETAHTHTRHKLSDAFWTEADRLNRIIDPDEESPENTDFDFDSLSDTEDTFLKHIIGCQNREDLPYTIYQKYIQEATWNRVEDARTGDVELVETQSFMESNLQHQQYLPDPDTVTEWGLYDYSTIGEESEFTSLWIRIREGETAHELPLINHTHGVGTIVDSDVDFGGVTSEHLSETMQEAIENRTSSAVSGLSETLVSDVCSIDDLGTHTQYFLDHATDSAKITTES